MVDVIEIDPSELDIDPLNERSENVGPHKDSESLENSIREQGIIQPPVARRSNGGYKIIVGQRRTLAAQSAGIDKIPVIVVDWNDDEALQASITENVDAFRKSVSRTDRSSAISKLMKMNSWSVDDVAEQLGVGNTTIKDWLEHSREEWEETVVDVNPSSDESHEATETAVETHSQNSVQLSKEEIEQISGTDLQTIRSGTKSAEERASVVKHVVEGDMSQREVREARKRSERSGRPMNETIREVSEERQNSQGGIRVDTRVTFTGKHAEALQRAARDSGTSEEQVVKGAIEAYLSQEGYL